MFNYLIVRSNSIHCSRERAQVVRVLRHAGHLVPFYRATLCVSAVFAVARCPSAGPDLQMWGPCSEKCVGPPSPSPMPSSGDYVFNFIIKYRIDKDLDNKLDF